MFDEEVYFDFAIRRRGQLVGLALRNVHKQFREDAEDIVQEVLLCVWKRREHIDDLERYLLHALKRAAFNWRGARIDRETGELTDELVRELAAPVDPLRQLLNTEKEHRLERVVRRLSPTQRKNFEEWVGRDYKCYDHTQALKASRVRCKLREAVARMAA